MRTLLLLAVLSLVAGCATKDDGAPDDTTNTNGTASGDGMGTMAPEDIQVTVGEGGTSVPPTLYTLAPKQLQLTVGHTYNLTLKNAGKIGHDLVIEGLDVKIPSTPAGATSEGVLFTPTEAGTFPMYCDIGTGPTSHKDQGMKGEVVVS